jgi:hypothetical protein
VSPHLLSIRFGARPNADLGYHQGLVSETQLEGEVRSGLGNRPDAVLLFDEIKISVIASDRRVILGLKQWD